MQDIPVQVIPDTFSTEEDAANAARIAGRQWVDDNGQQLYMYMSMPIIKNAQRERKEINEDKMKEQYRLLRFILEKLEYETALATIFIHGQWPARAAL